MRCVISQPRLFPGLHYLDRLATADTFIVLDTVQYNPRHEENRARIKTTAGAQWLTVPMRRTGRGQLINDTYVGDQPWIDKAVRTLQHAYGKAAHFEASFSEVEKVLRGGFETLVDLDIASWQPALDRIGQSAHVRRASEIAAEGSGSSYLLDLCLAVGATTYVSGGFGRDYLEMELFEAAGVAVEFHDYEYPVYDQQHGEFVPFLSYLDALFNVGLCRSFVLNGTTPGDD